MQIRWRFRYSSTTHTRFFFVYQLSKRMITFFCSATYSIREGQTDRQSAHFSRLERKAWDSQNTVSHLKEYDSQICATGKLSARQPKRPYSREQGIIVWKWKSLRREVCLSRRWWLSSPSRQWPPRGCVPGGNTGKSTEEPGNLFGREKCLSRRTVRRQTWIGDTMILFNSYCFTWN